LGCFLLLDRVDKSPHNHAKHYFRMSSNRGATERPASRVSGRHYRVGDSRSANPEIAATTVLV
jgi:hypothetical protein